MKNYQYYLKKIGEYGNVKEVNYPIVNVVGLPHAKAQEIVMFEKGQIGEVFSLEKDSIEILLFSKEPILNGDQVVRTDQFVSVTVGEELLGKIIDPLGSPVISGEKPAELKEKKELDTTVLGIDSRKRIERPFLTGVTVVDLLVPLGKGQRELIIGDRKTGKSAFLLTAVKNQVSQGTIVIYAAIGKKKSDVKKLEEFFEKEKLTQSVIMVTSDPFDSPSLIYLTPYCAMSIAEYFRDLGRDSVVIFDDLSTHAKFYREISLLGKRFPGRESYPGDIFYVHAKLLERAGNFKHKEKGEVSITALPIVETVEGDLSGFIATNIMGMTDGHIFFDSDIFYKGRRPAINVSLSVTRVGRQTQSPLKRELNREVTAFMANYDKVQNYSHFGAELSEKIKSILKTGEKIQIFFDQHYTLIVPEEIQLILFSLIWLHYLDDKSAEEIDEFRKKLVDAFQDSRIKKTFSEITRSDTFHDLLLKVAKRKEEFLSYAK